MSQELPTDLPCSSSQPPAHASALSGHAAKAVDVAKKKFAASMDDTLLDYKHNHPQVIENCANILIKIFTNILENPHEEKYRQVKATSNAFKAVTMARGGEQLMTLAGFKTQVMDLVKYWVFESDSHGIKDSILHECRTVLQKALHTIHEKAERKRKETEEKAKIEKERRDQIMLALEDDKIDRKIRTEVAVASALALEGQAAAAAAAAAAVAAAHHREQGSGPTSPRATAAGDTSQ